MNADLERSPSDLLAVIAGLMVNALGDAEAVGRLEAAIAAIEAGDPAAPSEEWRLDGATICKSTIRMLGGIPSSLPADPVGLETLVTQLQRLDRWHEPILPHNVDMPRQPEHDEAEERLFTRYPRLNADKDLGLIIPGRAWALPFAADGGELLDASAAPAGILLRLLDVTGYLPTTLQGADPDDDDPAASTRPIRLRYAIGRAGARGGIATEPIRIALAPMAEASDDIDLVVSNERYHIDPRYPCERIDAVVARAVDGGAHILMMPEMVVAEAEIDRLRAAIVRSRRAFAIRENRPPMLRHVCAGIAAKPDRPGSRHRNYILVLDADGATVITQHKLRHWNMDERSQRRFGVPVRSGGALCTKLSEDTVPGKEVVVTDLDGFGRLFTLVCADMDKAQPGNWLLRNVRIDWLYSPIMDGSTCWTQRSAPPWIIHRAAEAAALAGGRVIVTNSVAMTRWNNAATELARAADPTHPFIAYRDCGIGLLLDASRGTLNYHHVTTDLLSAASPIVELCGWDDGWRPLADRGT